MQIGHTKMCHGHFMRRKELKLYQTRGELLIVEHLFTHSRIHMETRNLEIPDNLYEVLCPK